MKYIRKILLLFLFVSASLQLLWGLWILIDMESVTSIFLGINIENGVLNSREFALMINALGKTFLMLSMYSFFVCYGVVKKYPFVIHMSTATGLIIALIALTTFLETLSPLVLLTDFLRGAIIFIFSVIYRRSLATKGNIS